MLADSLAAGSLFSNLKELAKTKTKIFANSTIYVHLFKSCQVTNLTHSLGSAVVTTVLVHRHLPVTEVNEREYLTFAKVLGSLKIAKLEHIMVFARNHINDCSLKTSTQNVEHKVYIIQGIERHSPIGY